MPRSKEYYCSLVCAFDRSFIYISNLKYFEKLNLSIWGNELEHSRPLPRLLEELSSDELENSRPLPRFLEALSDSSDDELERSRPLPRLYTFSSVEAPPPHYIFLVIKMLVIVFDIESVQNKKQVSIAIYFYMQFLI